MAGDRKSPNRRGPRAATGRRRRPAASTSWDPLASWYDGWVGEGGSEYHREVAVPALLQLLEPRKGERILDIGAGQGVLAPFVARAGALYTGVDASPRLIQLAQQRHGRDGRFVVGDARKLNASPDLEIGSFDAVTFLLSLQDMDPLDDALRGASWALGRKGRAILLLTHPGFRIPRQSGWGWDEGRKLVYRRIDRYLTPLPVPMKTHPGSNNQRTTRSFHRPIYQYVNGLSQNGMLVDHMDEIPAHKLKGAGPSPKAESTARGEIPLFLAIRARKID